VIEGQPAEELENLPLIHERWFEVMLGGWESWHAIKTKYPLVRSFDFS